jgi:hypothetical protein
MPLFASDLFHDAGFLEDIQRLEDGRQRQLRPVHKSTDGADWHALKCPVNDRCGSSATSELLDLVAVSFCNVE